MRVLNEKKKKKANRINANINPHLPDERQRHGILCVKVARALPGSLHRVTATETYKVPITKKSIYLWIRRRAEMSMRAGEKNLQLLPATFPSASAPRVGSDWLERRLDVIPWTGRRAQNGEVHKVTCAWSAPACLLSRVGVRARACVRV